MIRTKTQLIKQLRKVGEMKINQGILFRELASSIEQYADQKTLEEWKKLVNHKLNLDELK